MLEITYEIILDLQVALVNRRDERQLIHVLEDGARRIVPDFSGGVAIREAGDPAPVATLSDFLDREVEFISGHEIDQRRELQARLWLDRNLCPDEAHLHGRICRLKRLDDAHIRGERRRRGMQHGKVVMWRLMHDLGERDPERNRIDKLAVGYEGGNLGEPGRIPEGADFAPRLVARTGSAV